MIYYNTYILRSTKMSHFTCGPWTNTLLLKVYYLESRYQRSVFTTHFDDIYVVICKSDGITDQPNHCRKHILYQILYCVFRTSSQTGIARRNTWCLIFRNTQLQGYTQILLTLYWFFKIILIVFILPLARPIETF